MSSFGDKYVPLVQASVRGVSEGAKIRAVLAYASHCPPVDEHDVAADLGGIRPNVAFADVDTHGSAVDQVAASTLGLEVVFSMSARCLTVLTCLYPLISIALRCRQGICFDGLPRLWYHAQAAWHHAPKEVAPHSLPISRNTAICVAKPAVAAALWLLYWLRRIHRLRRVRA